MENNQFVIYQTDDGQTQIDVRMENDMIWLTRQQIAALFGRDYKTISKHINNVLKEKLAGSMVVAKSLKKMPRITCIQFNSAPWYGRRIMRRRQREWRVNKCNQV